MEQRVVEYRVASLRTVPAVQLRDINIDEVMFTMLRCITLIILYNGRHERTSRRTSRSCLIQVISILAATDECSTYTQQQRDRQCQIFYKVQ